MDKVKPGSFLGLPEATVQFRLRGLNDGPEARKYCQVFGPGNAASLLK